MVILISCNFSGLTYEFEQFKVNLDANSFCVKLSKHRFKNLTLSNIETSVTSDNELCFPIICLRKICLGKSQNLGNEERECQ